MRLKRQQGSPPHARGKVPSRRWWRRVPWDHPRMRGEKGRYLQGARDLSGSPPHARGKVGIYIGRTHPSRITPACAGKSSPPGCAPSRRKDHPRMRGEKRCCAVSGKMCRGSPPHARGKEGMSVFPAVDGRITPACAGKRVLWAAADPEARDHPRMRGEKGGAGFCRLPRRGSPPHARGKVAHRTAFLYVVRITPACAGKSCIRDRLYFFCWDHPRMRGEKPSS